ncbi:arylsulfatase A-like enzyme [Dysgonomonadaceae bacterium PH5-43]|nr:arylsulfatase A-like enzyme [Dysgonomonadaceae bacterium PH5-43]
MKYNKKLAATLSGALLASAGAVAQTENPNIVFILCDDLGYADLGCFGQQYISTPNLDRMAENGMKFTQHYSGSPVSAPSRASLLTGQHTGHTKIRDNKEYWSGQVTYGVNKDYAVAGQEPLDVNRLTITQMLKSAGYNTGLFGKWGLGYEGSVATPKKMGFDEFYGYICQFQAHLYYPNFINRNEERETLEENIKYPMYGVDYKKRTQYTPDLIHNEAIKFLEKQTKDTPFFAFLTYTLPHAELAQPNDSILQAYNGNFCTEKSYAGSEGSRYNPTDIAHAQFAAMVTRLDTYVGEVLNLLEEKGIAENTLVFFTSDNGPHTEGGADPDFFNTDEMLRGYKRALTEGGVRVPMIAQWKGTIEAGTESNHVSAFWDYMPTFAELTGTNLNVETDGISILPTLLGKSEQAKHDHLYWEFYGRAVRKDNWKLIRTGGNTYQLYDLATDLHEDNNLASQYPEIVKELDKIIEKEHTASSLFNFK